MRGRRCQCVLAIAALAIASACARAADYSAAANEAVTVDEHGRRRVELPPGSNSKPLVHQPVPPAGGVVYMIETERGLVECSGRVYRRDECRASSIGSIRMIRAWVVKRQGKWLQCGGPEASARCAGVNELFVGQTVL
jgi:hypothetical protein